MFSRVIDAKYLMASPLHSFKGSRNQRVWAPQRAGYKLCLGFGGKTEKGKRMYPHCPEVLIGGGAGIGGEKEKGRDEGGGRKDWGAI